MSGENNPRKKIEYALVNGINEFIESDTESLRKTNKSPLEIIEGP